MGDSCLSQRPSHFHQLFQKNSKAFHPRDKMSTALPWVCLLAASHVDLTEKPLQGGVGEPCRPEV